MAHFNGKDGGQEVDPGKLDVQEQNSGWKQSDEYIIYERENDEIKTHVYTNSKFSKSEGRLSNNTRDVWKYETPCSGKTGLRHVHTDPAKDGNLMNHAQTTEERTQRQGLQSESSDSKKSQHSRTSFGIPREMEVFQRRPIETGAYGRPRDGQKTDENNPKDVNVKENTGTDSELANVSLANKADMKENKPSNDADEWDRKKRRRRGQKRRESESEDFLKRTTTKQDYILLYVRLPQLTDKSYDIRAFLLARMDSESGLNFNVLKNESVGIQSVITVEFESKNQAKRAASLLKMSNRGSQMKLFCTFIRAEAMDQPVEKDEEELRKQIQGITKRATRALENHEEKIRLTSMQLEGLSTNKFVTLDEFEHQRIEKEALNDKLRELRKQREQFSTFLKSLVDKIKEVWNDNTYMKYITDLRREFGIECCRLENALPMYARRNDIISLVKDNQVSVILGETGSGKSTQMTQYLHQAGFSQNGIIVCTQPRKVAAISLATHVAKEMATNVGNVVGYKVGMRAKHGGATKILYMTDHCLLNECLKDPSLSAYSCVIVDEAHERSIYTDLLLGMLKMCLNQRPELKAIITSATIDPDVFVRYFGGCPVLRVSGRMFPVEVVYEGDEDGGKAFDRYVEDAVNKAVEIHKKEAPGDVLVFVTSPLETEKCSDMLKDILQGRTHFKCLILHGQIQPEEQQMVFQESPAGIRKIVFATNSAETSITIPGIKYVIDTGLVKEKRYDPRRNMSSLSVVVISRSSADQRKGRAGRTGPGRCYRLYTEQMYRDMEAVSQPEILKVHLEQAMLKLTELGINPTQYDFVQSPGTSAITTAMETLEELGAVKDNEITEDGKELAKLPVEPRLGLIIQKGRAEGALFDAIVLAAVSSMGSSIFYRGGSDDDKKKSDKLKMQFCHSGGDSLTLLNVYRMWSQQPEKQKANWCFNNAINSKTIRIVRDTVNEIITVLKKEKKLTVKHELQDPKVVDEKLQTILFHSYVSNICHFLGHARAGYYAARLDQQVHAHPSSVFNPLNMEPEWLVFQQFLKTSKDFITGLTPVDESWVVEAIASGHLKRSLEDMRNKKLVPVHTEHVGSHMFWKIVGPCFSKLRDFQAAALDLVKPGISVIEASKDKGELKIFSSDHSCNKLSHLFQPEMDTVKKALLAEDLEVTLNNETEKGGIRVVLGPGGAIKYILMPDEYKTVLIEKADVTTTEVCVRNKFGQFGNITTHKMFKNQRKWWGSITFESAEPAKSAVQNTWDHTALVAVPSNTGRGYQTSNFKVKITWCRRESKGYGYVNLEPDDIPRLLQKGHLLIRGISVSVQLNKKDHRSLYLRNLGPDITEEDIKEAILTALGYNEGEITVKVTVVREKVETNEKELGIIKQRLEASLKNYSPGGHYNVDVKKPFQSSRLFLAFAAFTDANEGIAACQGISKQMLMFGKRVTMEPDIKSSLFITREVYGAVKDDLDKYIQEFPTLGYSGVTIKSRTVQSGTVVDIHASDALEVAKTRTSLQKILQGDVLECGTTPNLRHLFTRSGRDFLRDVEETSHAHLQLDGRTLTISIRGKAQSRSAAIIAINGYLHDLAEGEWMQVDLRGRNKPKGLMKTLMNEFGLELEKLQEGTGLRSLILNFKQQVVKMSGTADSISKATSIIETAVAKLQEGVEITPPEEDLPDCSICLCPIEAKDIYRLEYCGHAYCTDCIKSQVECALKDHEFPLVCVQGSCGEPFMWKDVSNLVKQEILTVANLTRCSLSSYVKTNPHTYHYCPTADCSMVYRITSSGAVFKCPECDMRICTSCHVQSHDGLTCSMYQSAKTDEGMMAQWLRAHSDSTKKCPKCGIPIEKVSGCNRMICATCKCYFCWLCVESFSTENDCYEHLHNVHGGLYI